MTRLAIVPRSRKHAFLALRGYTAKHLLRIFLLGAVIAFDIAIPRAATAASPGSFQWPFSPFTTMPTVTQDYSCRGHNNLVSGTVNDNCASGTNYHAGIDIIPTTSDIGVYAAEAGKVVLLTSDCVSGDATCNQGLGNWVVLDHGNDLYSGYAHLQQNSISLVSGQQVAKGQLLGLMGDTGDATGQLHLHFGMGHSAAYPFINGYLPGHPDVYGYIDPWTYMAGATISPTPVKIVNQAGVNIRRGPGTVYSVFTQASANQRFVAFAKITHGADTWYRIHVPCGNDNSCAGWVAGNYLGVTYSAEEPSATQVQVANTGTIGLNVRSSPGGPTILDGVFDGQSFVASGTSRSGANCTKNWYPIYLPLSSNAASGWVCGDYLNITAGGGVAISSTKLQIAARGNHAVALKSNGTMLAWGENDDGELGDGTTTDRLNPVVVKDASGNPLTGVAAVAAGYDDAFVLKTDGTVLAWGNAGTLGDGTWTTRLNPVVVQYANGSPLTDVAALAPGFYHALALMTNGTVQAWGYNNYGQVGDGSTTVQLNPVAVKDASGNALSGVKAVAAGYNHSLAIKTDSTVLMWGRNNRGQLGDGTTTDRLSPVIVKDSNGNPLTGVATAVAGYEHTVALKMDGTVLAWGRNDWGQLGDGTTIDRLTPVVVMDTTGYPLSGIVTISVGDIHTLALKNDGTVLEWGGNVGPTPVVVKDASGNPLAGVVAIAAGGYHDIAVKSDGTVLAWGSNNRGQLGDGTTTNQLNPVTVLNTGNPIAGIKAIAAGGNYNVALNIAGTLLAWGRNGNGQLGDGTTTDRWNPVVVRDALGGPITGINAIAASIGSGPPRHAQTVALKSDGTLLTWGYNGYGQLGDGTTTDRWNPALVRDAAGNPITDIQSIAAGIRHTVALKTDGTLLAWGYNGYGQLGDGATTDEWNPVTVRDALGNSIDGIQAIAAGGDFTVALKSDGTLLTWGSNGYGQLGDGTTADRWNPVMVRDALGNSIAGVQAIAAGGYFAAALKSDGTLLIWGYNGYGQLGDGTTADRWNPVMVRDAAGNPITDIQSIAAGIDHTVALKTDGTLLAWGYNGYGQLGDGTTTDRWNPVLVRDAAGNPITDIQSIAAGLIHTVALKTDGTLLAWGYNGYGQLGDGATTDEWNPVPLRPLSTPLNLYVGVTLHGQVIGPGGQSLTGVNVTLSGGTTQLAVTDVNGYAFNELQPGTYTLTPSLSSYIFDPSSQSVNVSGVNITGVKFRACLAGAVLTGHLIDATTGTALSGISVNVDSRSAITDAQGNYSISGLSCGIHTVIVQGPGYSNYSRTQDSFNSWTWDIKLTKPATVLGLKTNSGYAADPVNTATGNYTYQRQDLMIPGPGMAFDFERAYNAQAASASTATDGPLGFGWTHTYNIALVDAAGVVTLHGEDGKTETFAPDGSGGYTPQYGVFDTLVHNSDGSYALKKKDLTVYNFDAAGRLVSIVDKNSNTLQMSYTGSDLTQITDTAGRHIDFSYDAGHHITTMTDTVGRTLQYAYDANGNQTSATDPNGNITQYSYDGSHQMLTITDPRGHGVVTNTYDALNRVVTYQQDAKGGQTGYVYDPLNSKTTITDALGNVTVDYHDQLLRLTQEIDARGMVAFYEYDERGNRVKVTDKNGNVTQYAYDSSGNVIKKTDALSNVTTITYDANNNPLSRTDALGNSTNFSYDLNGNLVSTLDAVGSTANVTYNAHGQPLTLVDGLGRTTTNTYDVQGNLIQVEDALGNKTQFTYDGVGRRLKATDALGRTTQYSYDHDGNLLSTTDADGHVTSASYDGNNNRVISTDRRGNVTKYAYDVKDLPIKLTDPLNGVASTDYDALDRKTSVTDKNGNTTQFGYDEVGNLIKATDALGNVARTIYDSNGNVLSITDPLSHTSQFTYDALNRKRTASDALGDTSNTAYDVVGRVVSTTNAKNQTTRYAYDAVGRLTQVTDANGGTVKYTYDAIGNRLSMTDPDGHTTRYVYDDLNRLITKTEPLGNVTHYAYDAVGNLSQVIKPNGTVIKYAYDNLNRLITITYPSGPPVNFVYDADGNRTQMTDSVGTATSVYDALNRMTGRTDAFGNTIGYGYDANGNRINLTYPGNKTVRYGVDADNRLVSVTDWLSHVTRYSYDATGHLIGDAYPNGTTTSYGYDNADRLTSLSSAKNAAAITSYSYTLDAIGNHMQVAANEPLAPAFTPGTANYHYDAENRLTQVNSAANSFDANGNITARGADSFSYDPEDRLVQSTLNSTNSEYRYDGVGNRLDKTVGAHTTRYVQDVSGSLSQVLADTDSSNAVSAYYVYGLGLIAQILPDGTSHYYHYDSRGSTIALTDATGAITDKYAYDPFGNLVNSTGSSANPFKYLGAHGVIDEGNGLYYIRARYYDPEAGRFINKDPQLGNDNDGQSLNRYVYGLNNPVRLIDINGYSAKEGDTSSNSKPSDDSSAHINLLNPPAPNPSKVFTEQETRSIINEALSKIENNNVVTNKIGAAKDYLDDMLLILQFVGIKSGSNTAEYDFGYQAKYQGKDFMVGGMEISPYQFGNYFAGYIATYRFGYAGYLEVRAGGVAYAWSENLSRSPGKKLVLWDSADSIKWINSGRDDAFRDRSINGGGAQ